jgi:Arc/MetJ-type ribon-helix-helix transcriptional regulator
MSKMITARTPDDLVRRIDEVVAAGIYRSRAAVVVEALERLVAELERLAIARSIVEGYTRIPPTAEELAWAEASARRSIADEPW